MIAAKILRRLGEGIDRRYLKKVGATSIPNSSLNLLLVCYHPYEGKKNVVLGDTVISPGEQIGELHLSNHRITQIAAEGSSRSLEWQLMEMLKTEMGSLAKACSDGVIPDRVRGFYGVNVLAAGARRLGFTLVPIPKGWNRWWLGFWESVLRLIYYSFKTKKKAQLQKTMDPYEVWISRQQLIDRFVK